MNEQLDDKQPPGTAGAASGDLRTRPLPLLLGELHRRRATGLLELGAGSDVRRIFLKDGRIASATSARGEHGAPVIVAGCALAAGAWTFSPQQVPAAVPRFDSHPFPVALAGVARAYPPAWIRAYLGPHAAEALVAGPDLASALGEARVADELGLLAGPVPVGRVLERDDASLVLPFALLAFGALRFAALAPGERAARPADGEQAIEASPPAGNESIEAQAARFATGDHYAVLGVPRGATDDELKRAYFALAKRWHTDAFAGRELGSSRAVVERVFARVSEAWKVLSDPAQRAEHDVFLERKAKGLPTDVATVFQAEEAFHKALVLFRGRKFAEAEAQLRQAVRLNPAEAEFWAYLGASCHRSRGAAAVDEARECFARARALIPQSLVTEFLEAQLEIGEGELDAAERRLEKILSEDPGHTEAARELRILRERRERESQGPRGMFGKLVKRK